MSDRTGAAVPSAALSPAAIDTGAVISFSHDTLVAGGEDIVAAIESRLLGPAAPMEPRDLWLTGEVPALARSGAWIVPLAWAPPVQGDGAAVRTLLGQRIGELWAAVRSSCEYRHGAQIGIDLDGAPERRDPYASELVRTGVRRADWWAFGDVAVVLAVHGDPLPAPVSQMAVHVVPVGWVSERRPTSRRKMPALDLAWSWQDVVRFASAASAGAESPGAAGSLDEQREGRES